MALYAIGDLHLSLTANKSMEVFGPAWENYTERIRASLSQLTAEDVLEALAGKLEESSLIRNSEVLVDGFTGFTPVQNKLLRELLKLAQQVWVTVTLEEKVSVAQLKRPQHLFRMSGEMMESLTRMAAIPFFQVKCHLFSLKYLEYSPLYIRYLLNR